MASIITDSASLKTAVIDYLDRPDLAGSVDAYLALAEAGFNQTLRAAEMEKTASIASGTSLGLPSDFLEWISVDWTGGVGRAYPAFVEANSPEARYKHRPNGPPQYFTISAQTVRLVPEQSGQIVLTYYGALPSLATNATNWLLTKAPDAYLYGVLGQAYLYQKDPSAAQAHMTLAMQALAALTNKADTQKVAKRPARTAEVEASAQAVARPE
jgi:hypothetical protein